MKRLGGTTRALGLALGLLWGLGYAASPQDETQTWSINFPTFFYAWINTDTVTFDFNSSATSFDGKLADVSVDGVTYRGANRANFEACINNPYIDGTTNPSGSFTGVTTAPTRPDCYFAPTTLTDDTAPTYTATYDDGTYHNGKADTDILVAARGLGGFQLETISATVPGGFTFRIYPMALEGGNVLRGVNPATAKAYLNSSASSVEVDWEGDDYGYYVSGSLFLYLMPLVHGLVLDPDAVDITTNPSVTVTYTISAL